MSQSVKMTIRTGETANTAAISDAERSRMIGEAAYYRAQNRCFENGDPVADWLAAEREIDARLSLPTDKPAPTTPLMTPPAVANPRGSRNRR